MSKPPLKRRILLFKSLISENGQKWVYYLFYAYHFPSKTCAFEVLTPSGFEWTKSTLIVHSAMGHLRKLYALISQSKKTHIIFLDFLVIWSFGEKGRCHRAARRATKGRSSSCTMSPSLFMVHSERRRRRCEPVEIHKFPKMTK